MLRFVAIRKLFNSVCRQNVLTLLSDVKFPFSQNLCCKRLRSSNLSISQSFKASRFSVCGSMLLEALIMVGLVAALTPVLYTHIADRKQEIEGINKANTMLMLQRETERFLQDDGRRGSLDFSGGPIVLNPSDLGGGISGNLDGSYKIGVKRSFDASGAEKVSAIIVETSGSGNDMKAAKVANLIGVSAGIMSAMDTSNAYGVNGLWKESLSDYGVEGVPAGSTVVTTEYNKQKETFYSSDMIINSDIDLGGHSLTGGEVVANKVCIGGDDEEHCRDRWGDADTDLMLLKMCQENLEFGVTNSEYCERAKLKGITDDCASIAKTFTEVDMEAQSGYYYLGSGYVKKVCFFKDGQVPTSAKQVIDTCNNAVDADRKWACMYDWQTGSQNAGGLHEGKKYMASCQSMYNADNSYATGYYTLTNAYSETGFTEGNPCVFASGKAANSADITINQCKAQSGSSTTSAACALGQIYDFINQKRNILHNEYS